MEGTGGGGDGPRDHVIASPGSSDMLLICEWSILPPIGGGGIAGISEGRGLADGEESGEKGLGYRKGGNVLSPDRVSEKDEGERASLRPGEGMVVGGREAGRVSSAQRSSNSPVEANSMQSIRSLNI